MKRDILLEAYASGDPDALAALLEGVAEAEDAPGECLRIAATPTPLDTLDDGRRVLHSWSGMPAYQRWARLMTLVAELMERDVSLSFWAALDLLLSARWDPWHRQLTSPWLERFLFEGDAHPAMSLFRAVDLSDTSGVEIMDRLDLRHLTHLKIFADFVDEVWQSLGRNPTLAGLTHLHLEGACTDECIRAPLGLTGGSLRHLALISCDIEESAVRELASAPQLAQLTHLDLGMNPDLNSNVFTGDALRALASSKHLRQLTYLEVQSYEDVEQACVVELLSSANIQHLTHLFLSFQIEDEAVMALTRSPHLGRLEHLNIWVTPIEERDDFDEDEENDHIGPEQAERLLRERFPGLASLETTC